MPDGTPLDAGALAEWVALSESLLRGLVHALNNRLTALAAFGELAALGDAEFAPDRVLPGELDRLQELGALFRLLVSDDGPPEAMALRVVVDDALALHAHHAGTRVARCIVEYQGAPATLRVPRWALLRLLLAALDAGRRSAEGARRDVVVLRVTSDDEWVTLRLDGPVPLGTSPCAMAMARLCGAAPATEADPGAIRIPTLPELRRRERLARETPGR